MITIDNLEVAQFVYLLLHNEKIREVIDTIGQECVVEGNGGRCSRPPPEQFPRERSIPVKTPCGGEA